MRYTAAATVAGKLPSVSRNVTALRAAGSWLYSQFAERYRQQLDAGFLGDVEFSQSIAARVHGIGTDQKYEELRSLDGRSNAVMEFVTRRQIGAVIEHLMALIP